MGTIQVDQIIGNYRCWSWNIAPVAKFPDFLACFEIIAARVHEAIRNDLGFAIFRIDGRSAIGLSIIATGSPPDFISGCQI